MKPSHENVCQLTAIFQTCGAVTLDPVTTHLPSDVIRQQSTRTSSPIGPGVTIMLGAGLKLEKFRK